MADIVIGGRLHSAATGNTVAGANEIMDDAQGKKQSVVNQETKERFNAYDTAILGRYTNAEINNLISNTPETDVIVVDIPAASQSDIAGWLDANTPSGTDPETGKSVRANKLYRVPGPDNTTYSEWAWDGTKYIMLANKDYGIDDEPTQESANFVKSGGVYKALVNIYEQKVYSTESRLLKVKDFNLKDGDAFELELLSNPNGSRIELFWMNTEQDHTSGTNYMELHNAGDKIIVVCPDNIHTNWFQFYNSGDNFSEYSIGIRRITQEEFHSKTIISKNSKAGFVCVAQFLPGSYNDVYKVSVLECLSTLNNLTIVDQKTGVFYNVGDNSGIPTLGSTIYITIPTDNRCALYLNGADSLDCKSETVYVGNVTFLRDKDIEETVKSIESNDIHFEHFYDNITVPNSSKQAVDIDLSEYKIGDTVGYKYVVNGDSTDIIAYLVREDETYINLGKVTENKQNILLSEKFAYIRFYKNYSPAYFKVAISKNYGLDSWITKQGEFPVLFKGDKTFFKTIKLIYNVEDDNDSYTIRVHYKKSGADKYVTAARDINQNKEYIIIIPEDVQNCDSSFNPELYADIQQSCVINYKIGLLSDTVNTDTITEDDKKAFVTSSAFPVLLYIKHDFDKILNIKYDANSDDLYNICVHYKQNGVDKYPVILRSAKQNKLYRIKLPQYVLDSDLDFEPQLYINTSSNTTVVYSVYKSDTEFDQIQNLRILILGDSYSQGANYVNAMSAWLPSDTKIVNLGVTSCTIRDKYQDRGTYPYTSRPVATDNAGNHNVLACQVEKLKRLMAGVDLDDGESQIYANEKDYPNVIILEGAMNDDIDSPETEATYLSQMSKRVDNVWMKAKSDASPQRGTCYIKTPISEVDRTCFAGAYRYVVEELTSLFPNAQIFITTASNMGYWTYDVVDRRCKQAEQQRKCAKMLGYTLIDWNAEGQINCITDSPTGSGTESDPYIWNDTTRQTLDLMHPNTIGGKKYGRLAALVIKQRYLNLLDE